MDAGSAADWVTAVVTACALGAAIWAGKIAAEAYRLEQKRQGQAEQRDQAAQASAVATWVIVQNAQQFKAVLRNGSTLPVYNVVVTYQSDEMPDMRGTAPLEVLGPGDVDLGYPHIWEDPIPGGSIKWVGALRLSVAFDDAAGARWNRDQSGRLSLIRAPAPTWTPRSPRTHV